MNEKKLINSKLQKWREWMEDIEPEILIDIPNGGKICQKNLKFLW